MTVADRIALIANGDLVEFGHARDIYRAPEKAFTASFVGDNNMLQGKVLTVNNATVTFDIASTELTVDKRGLALEQGQIVVLSIRSECVALDLATDSSTPADGMSLLGTYGESVYLGLTTSHLVRLSDGTEMISRVIADTDDTLPQAGAAVWLTWKPTDIRLHVA